MFETLDQQDIIRFLMEQSKRVDELIVKYMPRRVTPEYVEFLTGRSSANYNIELIQKTVFDPVWDLLDRGGKRWRPTLYFLILESLGGESDRSEDFSIIPEIIHNGTLIADDIEDNGLLRRGKPAIHRIYGQDVALNTCNLIYFLPMVVFKNHQDDFETEVLKRAYEVYVEEMINVSFGQAVDIGWHNNLDQDIQIEHYYEMACQKTGSMARMAIRLAAVFAGAPESTIEGLTVAIEKLAVAFQIQDDILDIELHGTDRAQFGKAYGNDITEGKRTLMAIHTVKTSTPAKRDRLLEILNMKSRNPAMIDEAIGLMKEASAIDFARDFAEKLKDDSVRKMQALLPEGDTRTMLLSLMHFMTARTH